MSLLLPQLGWAAVRPAESFVLCRHQQNVRSIGVFSTEGGCETHYSKGGVAEVVGRARHQDSCQGFMDNIRGNLEGANWSCRQVGKAAVSELAEDSARTVQ